MLIFLPATIRVYWPSVKIEPRSLMDRERISLHDVNPPDKNNVDYRRPQSEKMIREIQILHGEARHRLLRIGRNSWGQNERETLDPVRLLTQASERF